MQGLGLWHLKAVIANFCCLQAVCLIMWKKYTLYNKEAWH